MRTILFLVRKEMLQVRRDPMLLRMLIAVPIIQLLIVTSAATFEVKRADVLLDDADRTAMSRSLVDAFVASGRFVVREASSLDAADRALTDGWAGMVLRIPEGFQRDVVRHRSADVQVVLDGTDGVTAGVTNAYVQEILQRFGREQSAMLVPVSAAAGGLEIRMRARFNPHYDYDDFMASGILVLLVTIVGTVMTALNIAREKEQGTIEQLNVTPVTRGQFVAGKLIPFWGFALAELAVGLVVAHLVYAMPLRGSLLVVFAGAVVYLLTALGMGLLISTVSDTQQQAQFIAFFLLVIYLFLSGLFTPVASMPEWAQVFAEFNPVKHFIVVVRAVLLKGAGAEQLLREFAVLTAMAAVVLPLAVLRYSKTTS